MSIQKRLIWAVIIVLGAVSLAIVALTRGEPINAAWLVVAAACVHLIGYRFLMVFSSPTKCSA